MVSRLSTLAAVAVAGALSLGIGAAIGVGVVGASSPQPPATASGADQNALANTRSGQSPFPKNESGQTYGSELDALTPADRPDLISATASNGEEGYVFKDDLYPPITGGIDEALALNSAKARTISVYKNDGKTVIGSFIVDPPGGLVNSPPTR